MRCCLLVLILCQAGPVRSGKVTDAITHLPVEGATVILCCPQLSVTTDAGGFYTLQAESPTLLRIDKPGYAAIIIPFSDKHDFELKPGARVSGHVVDRDTGKPLAGFRVGARSRAAWPSALCQSKPSTEDGAFAIGENLSAGDYILQIDPPSRGRISAGKPGADAVDYGRSWYPNAPREEMAAPLAFSSGETREIELRVEKRALMHVAGVIQVPEGREKESFSFVVTNGPGPRVANAVEFKAGPFRIDGLEEGKYTLFATTQTGISLNREIEVGSRSVDDLKLTLRNDVTIKAAVTVLEDKVEPPKGMMLFPIPGVQGEFVVGPETSLRSEGLPAGRYWPALITPAGFAVTAVSYGGRAVTGPVEFEAAESTVNFVITSRPANLSGMARDANQNPVPDATVTLRPDGSPDAIDRVTQRKLTCTSDEHGSYRLPDLAPGRYRVSAGGSSEPVELDFGQAKTLDLIVK